MKEPPPAGALHQGPGGCTHTSQPTDREADGLTNHSSCVAAHPCTWRGGGLVMCVCRSGFAALFWLVSSWGPLVMEGGHVWLLDPAGALPGVAFPGGGGPATPRCDFRLRHEVCGITGHCPPQCGGGGGGGSARALRGHLALRLSLFPLEVIRSRCLKGTQ